MPIDGVVNGELVEQTKRRIERALRARANVLILEIKCAGGSNDKAHELGLYLASLNERRPDSPVETVAYVTNKARNLATFLAFGCNKIVMQLDEEAERKDADEDDDALPGEARLGGFGHYVSRHASTDWLRKEMTDHPGRRAELDQKLQEATANLEESLRAQLAEIAGKQMYPGVLAAGMFNKGLKIHLVERARGATGGRTLMAEDDYLADQKGPRLWRSVLLVKPWQGQPKLEGRYLTLPARPAKELGIAADVVKDLPELFQFVGVKQEDVKTVEADWLDGLADFLRDPWTSVVLVMVGITCLILELKMPGVGLPGVIAAICFVLFFWAHSQLHGQITWLAILLFVLGLVLIGLEIFVLPGFGVCGISGVLILLASLGLVAYGHWPRSSEEWVGFGHKIGPFGVSLLGSLILVALVLRYLPHIPVLNRLMSRPADEEEAAPGSDYPMHAELQALLGAIGVAATPLRPAGKTQFGDAFVDVVAEGRFITPGTRVQVIEVEGNRVVVKEV
ncbi:MAG: NfeD family protein [Gemmataceae bacterium]